MSDQNHQSSNGRRLPDERLSRALSDHWDRQVIRRRSGSAAQVVLEQASLESGSDIETLRHLEVLASADDLSAPAPGFLAKLERQLMQPIPVAMPEPSVPSTSIPPIRKPSALGIRQGHGVLDMVAVAAVILLLVVGSYSIWGGPPTDRDGPNVTNGVLGVATPEDEGTPEPQRTDVVALDHPWAVNAPNETISGLTPVNTTECVTPSRSAGSVLQGVENRLASDSPSLFEQQYSSDMQIDPLILPAATEDEIRVAESFLRQFVACRFDKGSQREPYTGAFWNLFATDLLAVNSANYVEGVLAGQSTLAAEGTSESLAELVAQTFQMASRTDFWSYAPTVLDARQLPSDLAGNARLLVTARGLSPNDVPATHVLVFEGGLWRYQISVNQNQEFLNSAPLAQVADIIVGRDPYAPRGDADFGSRLEAGFPVTMTVANVGTVPQRVIIGGQDVGAVEPGASIIIHPFTVSAGAVEEAGGRLPIVVESYPTNELDGRETFGTYTIGVYPPESLGPGSSFRGSESAESSNSTPTSATPPGTPLPSPQPEPTN